MPLGPEANPGEGGGGGERLPGMRMCRGVYRSVCGKARVYGGVGGDACAAIYGGVCTGERACRRECGGEVRTERNADGQDGNCHFVSAGLRYRY